MNSYHYEYLDSPSASNPGVSFAQLDGPSMMLPPAPRFIFGDLPAKLSTWYYSQRGLGKVGVYRVSDCELVETHMLRRGDAMFVCPELNIHPLHLDEALQRASRSSPRGARHLPGQYAVIGPGFGIYGHWLVEILPKLYLFESAGLSIGSLKFLIPENVPPFGKEWLHLLGISEGQLEYYRPEEETVSADELVLATLMHNGVRASHLFRGFARFLRGRLAAVDATLLDGVGKKRLFLSRARTSQARRLKNRDEIERIAMDFGFHLVFPEEMPILDQVRLLTQARELVGEYGSAMHGTLFSPPGTIVCAVRGSEPHPAFIQSGLGQVLGHPTGYVFGTTDQTDHTEAFSVDSSPFSDCLKLIFEGSQV